MKHLLPALYLLVLVGLTPNVGHAATGLDTWVGNTSANWSGSNWSGSNNPPVANDWLAFGVAGTSGLTLTNNFTSGTVFGSGTNAALTFNAGASAYVLTGNTVNIGTNGNQTFIINSSSNNQEIDFNLVLAASGIVNTGSSGGVNLKGNISGNFQLTKTGATTLTLGGTNTFGNLVIQTGTVSVAAVSTNLQGLSTIKIGNTTNTGTLLYTGTGETTGKTITLNGTTGGATIDQSGTGTLEFTSTAAITAGAGAKTLTLKGSTSGVGQIDGIIADNSGTNTTALSKSGTGTWVLTGANTYTGGTSITAGTLKVANTSGSATGSGAVSLGAATLTGTGAVTGVVTANNGANSILTPGSTTATGALSLGGLTATSGLTLNMAIDSSTGLTNSSLTLGSGGFLASGGTLTLNLYDLGANSLVSNTVYTLASGGTGWTAPTNINVTLNNSVYTLKNSYGSFGNGIDFSGNTLSFELAAVPEPSTWGMMLGGLVVLLLWQRRNAKRY